MPHEDNQTVVARREKTTTELVPGMNGYLPWRRGAVLLGGLIAAALLIGVSTAWAVPHIENNLEADARADLQVAGVDPDTLDVRFEYTEGLISGTLPPGVSAVTLESAMTLDDARSVRYQLIETSLEPEPVAEPEPTPEPTADTGPTDITVELTDGRIVLDGEVLTEAQRQTVVDAAAAIVGVDNVEDRLVVSGFDEATLGADDRVAALASLLASLDADTEGIAGLTDSTLRFRGSTSDQESADAITAAAAAVSILAAEAEVAVRTPSLEDEVGALGAELADLQAEIRENVTFELGSAELTDTARATLDMVAALLTAYELPFVSIEGHTDASGDADRNLELSQERAEAVRDYLVEVGVDVQRLGATGFGEEAPLVETDDSGLALENRRVEILAVTELPEEE